MTQDKRSIRTPVRRFATRLPARAILAGLVLLALAALGARWSGVWPRPSALPESRAEPSSPTNVPALTLNTLDRAAVAAFYHENYSGAPGVDPGWTGNHPACDEGGTSPEFRAAVLKRVNYFRAMAGVGAGVEFTDELNRRAQKTALMLSVNNKLTHYPDSDWLCYSKDGALAAAKSNLFLGVNSVAAIDGYMEDRGNTNYAVSHRRWLLNPGTQQMGTGDIPASGEYLAANALWVVSPATSPGYMRDPYVAWPPPGYTPYDLVFPRWSVSRDGMDLTRASVTMLHHGQRVALTVLKAVAGPGLNTLVWEPHIPPRKQTEVDTWYTVRVENALIKGWPASFEYTVVVFDPDTP
jgi:uncharacterized protein YkwD